VVAQKGFSNQREQCPLLFSEYLPELVSICAIQKVFYVRTEKDPFFFTLHCWSMEMMRGLGVQDWSRRKMTGLFRTTNILNGSQVCGP
jgi:hypothetical protein